MFGTPIVPCRSRIPTALSGAVAGILLVASVFVLVLAGVSLSRSRAQHLARAEVSAQNLCAVLGVNLADSYAKIDLALLAVKDEVERQFAQGGIDGSRLEATMERHRARIPGLDGIRTVDAGGVIVHGTAIAPGSRIVVADRDYFLRLRGDAGAGLVFSKPVLGRITGKWVITLARRIDRPDGTFAGVVQGSMALRDLVQLFSSIDIGRDGVIGLRDADLALVVRRPDLGGFDRTVGQRTVSAELQALMKAGRSSGTYIAGSPVDGVTRIYSFLRLPGSSGHLVFVGIGRDEALAGWRREAGQMAAFVLLFLLLLLASSWLVWRAWNCQRIAMEERERSIQELQRALAEVKTLSGLLPICANCKKIRDDHGYWNQIESYISAHSAAAFTHGICPDCTQLLYPELAEQRDVSGPPAS